MDHGIRIAAAMPEEGVGEEIDIAPQLIGGMLNGEADVRSGQQRCAKDCFKQRRILIVVKAQIVLCQIDVARRDVILLVESDAVLR